MTGLPHSNSAGGVQQTPVPVPLPPVRQLQSQPQQGNVALASSSAGSSEPAAVASGGGGGATVPSPAPGAAKDSAPPSVATPAGSQPSPSASAHSQAQKQPAPRPVPGPVTQTPIPAPVPLVSPRSIAAVVASGAPPPPLPPPPQSSLPSLPNVGTNNVPNSAKTPPRPSSPERPKVEPLTPPLGPVQFPPPRQSHAYPNHPEQQVGIAAPAPEPIEFDNNPDVLALKSAISILQLQSAKAKRDMVALQQAKQAALQDPEAFIEDLRSKKIRAEQPGLLATMKAAEDDEEDDSDSSSEDDTDMDGGDTAQQGDAQGSIKSESGVKSAVKKAKPPKPERKAWNQLPGKQNVVRMPPINWSQYAVVGDSLNKLHNEQVTHPSQGVPATIGADGTYVFQGAGRQEEYNGVMAPFDPLKDKVVKQPKPKTQSRQG